MRKRMIGILLATMVVCSAGGAQPVRQETIAKAQTNEMVPSTLQPSVAGYDLELQTVISLETGVTLNWKEKNATSYEICRDGEKIFTVSGGAVTSYVDQNVVMGQSYRYRVNGYVQGVLVYYGERGVTIGVPGCEWTGEVYRDQIAGAKTSLTSVSLEWSLANEKGLEPAGYEIYRGSSQNDLEKIETVENADLEVKKSDLMVPDVYTYQDTGLKKRSTYYYKVRAYGIADGKTVYGAFSDVMRYKTVNQYGKYDWKILSNKGGKSPYTTAVITSKKGNAELALKEKTFYGFGYTKKNKAKAKYYTINLISYSKNGKQWSKGKAVKLKEGERLYLRMKLKDQKGKIVKPVSLSSLKLDQEVVSGVYYGGVPSQFCFDLKKDTGFQTTLSYRFFS